MLLLLFMNYMFWMLARSRLGALVAKVSSRVRPRNAEYILKLRSRGGKKRSIHCYASSGPVGRCDSPTVNPPLRLQPCSCVQTWSGSSSLIWLWNDFQAAVFWASLNASMENRCPTGEDFFSILSTPTSAYKQDVAAAVRQTNQQVCLCWKWLADFLSCRKAVLRRKCF